MSINFKQEFKRTAAATALAALVFTAPMSLNDAHAADRGAGAGSNSTEMTFSREIQRPTLPAKFRGANLRTDNPEAQHYSDLARQDFPSAASDDRISLTIYGGNSNTKAAVQDAGRMLAERVIGVTYIELDDHDNDPNMVKILICVDGRCVREINTPIDHEGTKIVKAVVTQAVAAYREHIEPFLVDQPTLAFAN